MRRYQTLYFVTAVVGLFTFLLVAFLLVRTGLPSADVIAREKERRPIIRVSDFAPGEVKFMAFNNRRVLVWRRNKADMTLAESQNVPELWRHKSSNVLGFSKAVFSDDANLTLGGEWFFALAEFPNKFKYLLPRSGDFEGLFEGRYASHFDLAGRVRKGYGTANLSVIEAEYVDDGRRIRLYVADAPRY